MSSGSRPLEPLLSGQIPQCAETLIFALPPLPREPILRGREAFNGGLRGLLLLKSKRGRVTVVSAWILAGSATV